MSAIEYTIDDLKRRVADLERDKFTLTLAIDRQKSNLELLMFALAQVVVLGIIFFAR